MKNVLEKAAGFILAPVAGALVSRIVTAKIADAKTAGYVSALVHAGGAVAAHVAEGRVRGKGMKAAARGATWGEGFSATLEAINVNVASAPTVTATGMPGSLPFYKRLAGFLETADVKKLRAA